MYPVRAVEDAGPYKLAKRDRFYEPVSFYFIGQFRKISFAADS